MNQPNGLVHVVALVLTLGLASEALGQQGFDGEHRATADSAGLDPSKAEDAEILYRRIRSASHSVCRAQKAIWDVKRVQHQRQCVETALEDAVARADEPLLTAVHRASNERVAGR